MSCPTPKVLVPLPSPLPGPVLLPDPPPPPCLVDCVCGPKIADCPPAPGCAYLFSCGGGASPGSDGSCGACGAPSAGGGGRPSPGARPLPEVRRPKCAAWNCCVRLGERWRVIEGSCPNWCDCMAPGLSGLWLSVITLW